MAVQLLGIVRTGQLARLGTASAESPDAAIAWIPEGPLAAAAAACAPSSPTPMEQAALLKAIHRRLDVLPVRFGATMPDEQAVREFLRVRMETLLGELTRLEGTGEIGVRIEVRQGFEPAQPSTSVRRVDAAMSPGEYLALRRHQYADNDRRNHEADLVSGRHVLAVEGLFRERRSLTPVRPGQVRLAFLVERSRWHAVLSRLGLIASQATTADSTLVGPWPPYSFVRAEAAP